MSKERLVPICKEQGGWLGEEVNDNCDLLCPVCGELVGVNICSYDKCPNCNQLLEERNAYDYESSEYYEQLVKIKNQQIAELEKQLAEQPKAIVEKIRETYDLYKDNGDEFITMTCLYNDLKLLLKEYSNE